MTRHRHGGGVHAEAVVERSAMVRRRAAIRNGRFLVARISSGSTILRNASSISRTGNIDTGIVMHTHKHLERLSLTELRALEERVARGETTFDEEMELIIANGCRPDEAAFEAALERALCRGEDPTPPADDPDDIDERS
jgi:hypothetical protein